MKHSIPNHNVGRELQQPFKVLLSRQDLKALGITVSNSTLLRWESLGRFPRRIRMAGTSVSWLAVEVYAWLDERAEERARHVYADPHN